MILNNFLSNTFEKFKDIENNQVQIINTKPPDSQEFQDRVQVLNRRIDEIRQLEFLEETQELQRSEKEIENDEIFLAALVQNNFDLSQEIQKLQTEAEFISKSIEDLQRNYETEEKNIDEVYHEQILKNIERRNYLQKLNILALENKKRKSRGLRD
jgi:hypothetical protein